MQEKKERMDYMREKVVIEKLAGILAKNELITIEESLKLKELIRKERP